MLLPTLLLGAVAAAADSCPVAQPGEPTRIYLLTTVPGDDLTSLMGHSALWVSGGNYPKGIVYNWGAFDSRQGQVVSRFLHGTLDFWLDAESYGSMEKRVKRERRTLYAQRLDIEAAAADALAARLSTDSAPERRAYPYHWVERNCASQVRDAIDAATGGALHAAVGDGPSGVTARSEVLRHFSPMLPVWFGWNLLAGPYTDRPLSQYESLFIPERLMGAVDGAKRPDGQPLVTARCTLLQGETPFAPPVAPGHLGLLWGAGIGTGAAMWGLAGRAAQRGARIALGLLMSLYGLLCGGTGTLVLVLWLISTLAGVGPNPITILANPLLFGLFFGGGLAIARGRLGWVERARRLEPLLLGLAALSLPVALWAGTDLVGAYGLFLPPLVGGLRGLSRLSSNQARSPYLSS